MNWGFLGGPSGKEPTYGPYIGAVRATGSIPDSRRSPGGGHGNLLQYSCLENPVVREAWRAAVHRVEKSQT